MRRSLDHITVTVRCIARKSISPLGFLATTFPFKAPSGITTAGIVEKEEVEEKNWMRTHNMRSLRKAEFRRRINSKLSLDKSSFIGILSSATYVFCNFLAVFLEWRFRSWRISSRFLRGLRRVRLPLMCSLSSVSALHPPRWLQNHRRMNGSVLPRSHSLPSGWEGLTARLAPSPHLNHCCPPDDYLTLRLPNKM